MALYEKMIDVWSQYYSPMDFRVYWEGNYYDNDVHDYAEVGEKTFRVLINKCSQIFHSIGVSKGTRILLYLPNVLQLPVAAIACLNVGAVIVTEDPRKDNVKDLVLLLDSTSPSVVITLDGFWSGRHLISSKNTLDEAITQAKKKPEHVLVIRHTSPNEGIPPPRKVLIGKRPYYSLKVCALMTLVHLISVGP
ncbi:hypothetical protein AB6A40_007482 [Gnathostoma spinigerum]|uniref:acetate--CoA ligase n=1 Tax=Gnathostoma spinigerum TaxID=75299 RepID=A0ABD6EUP9_9BILA